MNHINYIYEEQKEKIQKKSWDSTKEKLDDIVNTLQQYHTFTEWDAEYWTLKEETNKTKTTEAVENKSSEKSWSWNKKIETPSRPDAAEMWSITIPYHKGVINDYKDLCVCDELNEDGSLCVFSLNTDSQVENTDQTQTPTASYSIWRKGMTLYRSAASLYRDADKLIGFNEGFICLSPASHIKFRKDFTYKGSKGESVKSKSLNTMTLRQGWSTLYDWESELYRKPYGGWNFFSKVVSSNNFNLNLLFITDNAAILDEKTNIIYINSRKIKNRYHSKDEEEKKIFFLQPMDFFEIFFFFGGNLNKYEKVFLDYSFSWLDKYYNYQDTLTPILKIQLKDYSNDFSAYTKGDNRLYISIS